MRYLPVLFVCLVFVNFVFASEVQIKTEPLVLPTYETGEPDVNPIYFTGRTYQGAQGHIYPYPLYDVLTDNKVDKKYNAVELENDFIKVCVLPEIGGRILSATDKTDNYEFFYRQNVIKPALIGMLGAWISGGVEWNIPYHHRPSSFMPIDWKTTENPDGSKTIWVGETEFRHRLKWSVGLTLHPDSSVLEAKVRIMNRSPLIQSFLYWANVSVHCDENYQVIFPPSVQFGTGHSKTEFRCWNIDNGTDISWWKNFEKPSSVFAWDFDNDFLAGYDFAKKAGTVHFANHHIVGGKKFFLWGNNSESKMWEKMLTDTDGQYLELMVGAYSDNQPDYSWIYPGEVREFTQYWYPIRGIKSVKNANKNAAVNLERIAPNKVFLGFHTTKEHKNAKVVLRDKNRTLFDKSIDIDPAHPFTAEIEIPETVKNEELLTTIHSKEDGVLISYIPAILPETKELPKPVETVKAPAEYSSVEELYLTGLRIEQFHNARLDPMLYYNEALKRDPNDSRVNTVVGIRLAKQAKWKEAEEHLRRAVERLSKNYTTPKDNEANYYLGYVLEQQRNFEEAKDQYWKATWSTAYQAEAYYSLARLNFAYLSSDWGIEKALQLVNESLRVNSHNTKALTYKAFLLWKRGRENEAKQCLEEVRKIDPLDFHSVVEQAILDEKDIGEVIRTELPHRGEGFVRLQEVLEIVNDYFIWEECSPDIAKSILHSAIEQDKTFSNSPLVNLYAGKKNTACALPPDYCFPFRPEEIKIFEEVISCCPNEPVGYYLLGNLLYYLEQKDRAIENWEKAAALNPKYGQVLRNLGFAYSQKGDNKKAAEFYEKAVAENVITTRLLVELDKLCEQTGKSVAERLALYEKFKDTVFKHDDAVIRLIGMYNQAGHFDKGIDILSKRHFHVWEGGGDVHRYFVDAHLLAGIQKLQNKDFDGAAAEFNTADEYPDNLEVGRPASGGHSAKVFYYLGKAQQGLKDETAAKKAFETAVKQGGSGELQFYKAMSFKELGNTADFEKEIAAFAESVKKQKENKELIDQFSKFGEDGSRSERVAQLQYLSGLVHLAKGEADAAKQDFETAVKANPDLIWAKKFLDSPR